MTEHFNRLSPAEAERLAMLSEEAGEIVQSVGKILRHGYASFHPFIDGVDNRAHLRAEIEDLMAVVRAMERAGDFIDERWERKLRFAHHQVPRP